MNKITIFVATHGPNINKDINFDDARKTILVGAYKNQSNEKIDFFDNTKDNISNLNIFYSELTALYWIWKNDRSSIVGLEHYRRFFIEKNYNFYSYKALSGKKIFNHLRKYDLIVPKPIKSSNSLYKNYYNSHHIADLEKVIKFLSKDFNEYKLILGFFKNTRLFYPANMFIAHRKIFEEYASWLFNILFNIDLKESELLIRDKYQQRVFGFLSERLFTYYLLNNNLKIKRLSIVDFSNERGVFIKKTIQYIPMFIRVIIAKIRGRS